MEVTTVETIDPDDASFLLSIGVVGIGGVQVVLKDSQAVEMLYLQTTNVVLKKLMRLMGRTEDLFSFISKHYNSDSKQKKDQVDFSNSTDSLYYL